MSKYFHRYSWKYSESDVKYTNSLPFPSQDILIWILWSWYSNTEYQYPISSKIIQNKVGYQLENRHGIGSQLHLHIYQIMTSMSEPLISFGFNFFQFGHYKELDFLLQTPHEELSLQTILWFLPAYHQEILHQF